MTIVSFLPGQQDFLNRLQKNARHIGRWAKKQGIYCYRLYDNDLPEFAFAIDIYEDWVCVQEYAPPPQVDVVRAQQRREAVEQILPTALNVPPERVVWKTRQRQRGTEQYQKQGEAKQFFAVREGKAQLWVNLHDYLDTGLFLDHRPLRLHLAATAQNCRFLNLFAYTGTATVHAAIGGAIGSVTVDLSNTYCQWAQRNFQLNQLELSRHHIVCDDVMRWLAQSQGTFDLIFVDPPTFSNSKKLHDIFEIQRDHEALLNLALARLAPGGVLYFSNNYRRFQFTASLPANLTVTEITPSTIPLDFQRQTKIHRCWRLEKSN